MIYRWFSTLIHITSGLPYHLVWTLGVYFSVGTNFLKVKNKEPDSLVVRRGLTIRVCGGHAWLTHWWARTLGLSSTGTVTFPFELLSPCRHTRQLYKNTRTRRYLEEAFTAPVGCEYKMCGKFWVQSLGYIYVAVDEFVCMLFSLYSSSNESIVLYWSSNLKFKMPVKFSNMQCPARLHSTSSCVSSYIKFVHETWCHVYSLCSNWWAAMHEALPPGIAPVAISLMFSWCINSVKRTCNALKLQYWTLYTAHVY